MVRASSLLDFNASSSRLQDSKASTRAGRSVMARSSIGDLKASSRISKLAPFESGRRSVIEDGASSRLSTQALVDVKPQPDLPRIAKPKAKLTPFDDAEVAPIVNQLKEQLRHQNEKADARKGMLKNKKHPLPKRTTAEILCDQMLVSKASDEATIRAAGLPEG